MPLAWHLLRYFRVSFVIIMSLDSPVPSGKTFSMADVMQTLYLDDVCPGGAQSTEPLEGRARDAGHNIDYASAGTKIRFKMT